MDGNAEVVNERIAERKVLDALDAIVSALERIEKLLTPTTTTVYMGTLPSNRVGYQCGVCRQWVMPDTSHYCTGGYGGAED